MTASGIRAAIDAGAGAVVAKSVNESPQAARQLSSADYVLLDETGGPFPGIPPNVTKLHCSAVPGLAQMPLDEWLPMLAQLAAYAQTNNSIVAGSITVAAANRRLRLPRAWKRPDCAGLSST